MREEMTEAQREGFGPGNAGWESFALARAAISDAMVLGDKGEGLASAVLLLRSAMLLLIRSHLDRLGVELARDHAGDECWAKLIEQPSMADITSDVSQRHLKDFAGIFGVHGEQYVAGQSGEELDLIAGSMFECARRLAAPFEIEARRVPRVRAKRRIRVAIAAVVVASLLGFVGHRLSYRPNLALHKRVIVEKSHPTFGRDPSALVDGNRAEMAFHTTDGPNQAATIDLGASQRVTRVVVYNRSDCCQERAVPLTIEVSEDGKTFREVARRTETFMQDWRADFSPANARYVRLTDLSANPLHLAEVEVY